MSVRTMALEIAVSNILISLSALSIVIVLEKHSVVKCKRLI